MFSSQPLKNKLKNNQLVVGTWISIYHPSIVEMACRAGFDWIGIDLEHSVISISDVEQIIRVTNLMDKTPLVRLTSNNSDQIKRVMDAGANGIIVPMVESREDVIKASDAMYYEPDGKRGVGLARAQNYGAGFEAYRSNLKVNGVLVVQIENVSAVDHLDDIFSHANVDAYMIGPYDLSSSMGIPGKFDSKDFIEVVNKIHNAARKYNIPGGVHIVEPSLELLKSSIAANDTFITYSVDIRIIDSSYREAIESIKEGFL